MRKTQAWLDRGGFRTSNTLPMSEEKKARLWRKSEAKRTGASAKKNKETGTLSYPTPKEPAP